MAAQRSGRVSILLEQRKDQEHMMYGHVPAERTLERASVSVFFSVAFLGGYTGKLIKQAAEKTVKTCGGQS